MARKALGKGLDALISSRSGGDDLIQLDIDLIRPNREQPRSRFDDDSLKELAASIKSNGIIQPIIVRPLGGHYEIVAGERRWRAAQLAGLRKVPAVVREVADDKILELALIENIQREDLNPVEEAKAYHLLTENLKLTQQQIAERVGKERSSVANYLRLLNLPEKVQNMVSDELLSMGQARTILGISDPGMQEKAALEVVRKDMSVRQVERYVKILREGKKSKSEPQKDVHTVRAEEKLERRLGTKVVIKRKKKGGQIVIDFHDEDDLDRLFSLISGK